MSNLYDYITLMLGDMPGLSWFKYVVVALILLIVIDVAITALIAAIQTLFGGQKR